MWDWPLVLCTENMSVVSTDVFLLLLDVQHVLWRFFTSEFKKTGWVSTKSCMLLGKFTVPFKLLLLDNDKILISRQSRRLEEKKCLESVYYIAWQQYWTAFFFFNYSLSFKGISNLWPFSSPESLSLNLPPWPWGTSMKTWEREDRHWGPRHLSQPCQSMS